MADPIHLTIGEKKVFRIGLGTNRISDNGRSKDALKKAVSLGINFIDTASAYTGGVSEKVIGETLYPYDNIVVATKGGMVAPDFHVDSRPEILSRQLEDSLNKLKLDSIDLYFLHRVDHEVPLKESIQFLKAMQEKGKINHIGLSEVTVSQIEEARELVNIVAVENEYNLSQHKYDEVVEYCEKANIVFIPFYPLHYHITDKTVWKDLEKKYQVTETQLALAWLLKRSPVMLPIPGSLSDDHLSQNVGASHISLSNEDFQALANAA